MYEYTYTDTFGGEPNFSWVRRVTAKSFREAKSLLGLTNAPFRKTWEGCWKQVGACCVILETETNPIHKYRAAFLECHYLGATNTRESRVRVTLPHWYSGNGSKDKRKTLSWDYGAANESGHNCDMVAIVENAIGIKCESYVQTSKGYGIVFSSEDWDTVRDFMVGKEKGE